MKRIKNRQALKNVRNPKMRVNPSGGHVQYRALSKRIVNGKVYVVDPAGQPMWVDAPNPMWDNDL